jgi:hypothetical protein
MQELPYGQIWLCENPREPAVPTLPCLTLVEGCYVDPDAETGIQYDMCRSDAMIGRVSLDGDDLVA